MTLLKLLALPASDLEAITDAQWLIYFGPYLKHVRPSADTVVTKSQPKKPSSSSGNGRIDTSKIQKIMEFLK